MWILFMQRERGKDLSGYPAQMSGLDSQKKIIIPPEVFNWEPEQENEFLDAVGGWGKRTLCLI
jgi:hypothetical protein